MIVPDVLSCLFINIILLIDYNLIPETKIRDLYQPIQPAVKELDNQVFYNEWIPDPYLSPFIYCYWQLKTAVPLEQPFSYKVVADGCIDIFFELNTPGENFVMGFCKKYTEFELGNEFHYIGIRFLPTMFPQIFKINATDISNRFESLKLISAQTASFIERSFNIHQNGVIIKSLLDDYFKKLVAQADFNNDSRLYEAIDIILSNYGMIKIEEEINTGISQRQLRRLFEYYIGDTAKTFCKVVRFQHILKAKPSTQSLRQNKLFFDAGYYDQAHFIKEFKNFYGLTPSKAFGR